MKVDLSVELKDLAGKPFEDPEGKLTLKLVCTRVLATPVPTLDQNLPGEKALERWHLAMRVHQGGIQSFTPEELSLIRSRLTSVWAPLVAGQAYELLGVDAEAPKE